jgi:hypothetical protein
MRVVRITAFLTSVALFSAVAGSSSMAGSFCDSGQSKSKPFASLVQACAPKSGSFAASCKGGPNLPNPCCCSNGNGKGKSGEGLAQCSDPRFSTLSPCDSPS